MGPSTLVLSYFTDGLLGFRLPDNENPADFFLDVLTGVSPREGDEDFVPRELYDLWDHLGATWVNARLLAALQQQQHLGGRVSATSASVHHAGAAPTTPAPPANDAPGAPTTADADTVLVRLRGGDSVLLPAKVLRRFSTLQRLQSLRSTTAQRPRRQSNDAVPIGAPQPSTGPSPVGGAGTPAPQQLRLPGQTSGLSLASPVPGHLGWLREAIDEEGEEDDEGGLPDGAQAADALIPATSATGDFASPFVRSGSSLPLAASLARSLSLAPREGSQLLSQAAQLRMLIAASLQEQQSGGSGGAAAAVLPSNAGSEPLGAHLSKAPHLQSAALDASVASDSHHHQEPDRQTPQERSGVPPLQLPAAGDSNQSGQPPAAAHPPSVLLSQGTPSAG